MTAVSEIPVDDKPAPRKRASRKTTTTPSVPDDAVVEIVVPKMDIRVVHIRLEGTSPLISHRWSEKAKKMMLDKQTGKASVGRDIKDPDEDFRDSLYIIPGTENTDHEQYGFPCVAFKAAAVRAGTYSDMKMTFLRGAFHVRGELAVIEGTPRKREDMVRIGMGKADIRYRGEFPEWKTTLRVEFNAKAISLEQLFNLFTIAGFSVGVGEWRPERGASFGTFKLATD